MTDEAIVSLYWQRDESAIRETDRKYGGYCMDLIRRTLDDRSDCEECLNDTWMHAWNAIPPARPTVLRLFLARIARNLSFDRFRKLRAEKRGAGLVPAVLEELNDCIPGRSDVESTVDAKLLGEVVNRFVRSLPERDGNVFIRRYFYCESVCEIAKRYGLTQGNVSVILNRSRKKLKALLQKEGYTV